LMKISINFDAYQRNSGFFLKKMLFCVKYIVKKNLRTKLWPTTVLDRLI
jgi:hypothetical protein